MEHLRYPNESTEYRAARNALLNDEIALRAQIEAVAAKRRALPMGGEVPERERPCPGCTHLLDGLDGAARHMGQRAALYIVAKSSIARLAAWAHERGWDHLSLVSTAGNSYDADYFGDTSKFPKGLRAQHRVPNDENWDETIFNVFKRHDGIIRHFWGSEMSFAPTVPNQHHRAGDLVDPLWGLLDMTPEGRGDFFPKVNYL